MPDQMKEQDLVPKRANLSEIESKPPVVGSEFVKDQMTQMAEAAIVDLDQKLTPKLFENPTDAEIAQALGELKLSGPTLNLEKPTSQDLLNAGWIFAAKADKLAKKLPKQRDSINSLSDTILDKVSKVIAEKGGKKAMAATATLGMLVVACQPQNEVSGPIDMPTEIASVATATMTPEELRDVFRAETIDAPVFENLNLEVDVVERINIEGLDSSSPQDSNLLEIVGVIEEVAEGEGIKGDVDLFEMKDKEGNPLGLVARINDVEKNESFWVFGVSDQGDLVPIGYYPGLYFWQAAFIAGNDGVFATGGLLTTSDGEKALLPFITFNEGNAYLNTLWGEGDPVLIDNFATPTVESEGQRAQGVTLIRFETGEIASFESVPEEVEALATEEVKAEIESGNLTWKSHAELGWTLVDKDKEVIWFTHEDAKGEMKLMERISANEILERAVQRIDISVPLVGTVFIEGEEVNINFPDIQPQITVMLDPTNTVPYEGKYPRLAVKEIKPATEWYQENVPDGSAELQFTADILYVHYHAWRYDKNGEYYEERKDVGFSDWLTMIDNGETDGSHDLRLNMDASEEIAYAESKKRIKPLDPTIIVAGDYREEGSPFMGGTSNDDNDFAFDPVSQKFIFVDNVRFFVSDLDNGPYEGPWKSMNQSYSLNYNNYMAFFSAGFSHMIYYENYQYGSSPMPYLLYQQTDEEVYKAHFLLYALHPDKYYVPFFFVPDVGDYNFRW